MYLAQKNVIFLIFLFVFFFNVKYQQIYIIVKTEIHEDNMNYFIHVFPNTDLFEKIYFADRYFNLSKIFIKY